MVCFWQWSLFLVEPHPVFRCVGCVRERKRCKWSVVRQTKNREPINRPDSSKSTKNKNTLFNLSGVFLHVTCTHTISTTHHCSSGQTLCFQPAFYVFSTSVPPAVHSVKEHKQYWVMWDPFPTAWLLWWSLF